MKLPQQASLLPKLRDHYAEFLDLVSLVHLRLLASPTCVGLRYGRPIELPVRAFLACRLQKTRLGANPRTRTPVSGGITLPTRLDGQSTRPLSLRSSVPLTGQTLTGRGRNLNRLSIDYASGASS